MVVLYTHCDYCVVRLPGPHVLAVLIRLSNSSIFELSWFYVIDTATLFTTSAQPFVKGHDVPGHSV